MYTELDLQRPPTDMGPMVAAALPPPHGILPTQDVVEQRLGAIFDAMRERDQQSNDVIAEYIRVCQEWTSSTRHGSPYSGDEDFDYYCIDTHFTHQDGSATLIELSYRMPAVEPADSYDEPARERLIRERMLSKLPELPGVGMLDENDIANFIANTAEFAQVRHVTAEAVQLLRGDAADGVPLRDILKMHYRRKQAYEIIEYNDGPGVAWDIPDPSWMHDVLSDEVTHSTVYLKGQVEGEDSADHIASARKRAEQTGIEHATHGEEYHRLHNRYRHDGSLSDAEKEAIAKRLEQINTENGFPDIHFLEWRPTHFLEHGMIMDAKTTAGTDWSPEVLAALQKDLGELGLYLYELAVRTRTVAAHAIKQMQLADNNSGREVGDKVSN